MANKKPLILDPDQEMIDRISQNLPVPIRAIPYFPGIGNMPVRKFFADCKGCGANKFSIHGECSYCGRDSNGEEWKNFSYNSDFMNDEWYKRIAQLERSIHLKRNFY